jgi:excisionase family DNA binding protein
MVKKTYRPDEVAEILRLSKRTIYRMIKDGRLPTIAPGINRVSGKVLEKMLGVSEVNNLHSDE